MSYQVLARKWRPNKFTELVGQEHVVSALTNALDNNRLHHAYLFTGTRGVGKTTIARIFSKSLNCELGTSSQPCGKCGTCLEIEQGNYVDLLEIDAASRTKVEDTRELLDNVQYKPSRGEYKVYLIDEVHMLSKHSFNALLKTLEEPPPHVKFLLATTDPQKLPVTILSRCLQFNLKALSREQIQGQLSHILEHENIAFEPGALSQLAKSANGSMRDALSLTDQAIAQGNNQVAQTVVADMLGLMDKNQVLKLAHALLSKQSEKVMQLVEEMAFQGPDFSQLLAELMAVFHQVALTQFVPDACKLESDSAKAIYTLAKAMPAEQVQLFYQLALQGRKDIAFATDGRSGFEMVMLRMLAFQPAPISLAALDDTPTIDTRAVAPAESSVSAEPEAVSDVFPDVAGLTAEQHDIEQQAENLRRSALPDMPPAYEPTREVHPQNNFDVSEEHQPPHVEDVAQPGMPESAVEQNNGGMSTAEEHESSPEGFNPHPSEYSDAGASEPEAATQVSQTSSTASLLALKQALDGAPEQYGGNEPPVKKSEPEPSFEREQSISFAEGHAETPSQQPDVDSEPKTFEVPSSEQAHEAPFTKSDVASSLTNPPSESKTPDTTVPNEQPLTPPWDVPEDKPPAFLETIVATPPAAEQEKGAAYEQLTPPWNIENSEHITQVSFEKAGPVESADTEFDPTAHLNEQLEVEVDFDVPAFLPQGDKVTSSHQLDTWSHMIEAMPISALTKQLALHAAYTLEGNVVTLTLPEGKQHLNNETAFNQLQQALSDTLKQPISLQIMVSEPKNTPFAVQQKINLVRQQHAESVVQHNEQIGLLRDTFSAEVVENSIKPR